MPEQNSVQVQAGQLCAVLEEHGEKYLESWQVPMLTWDELQELKQMYEGAPLPALENPLTGQQLDWRPIGKYLLSCNHFVMLLQSKAMCGPACSMDAA